MSIIDFGRAGAHFKATAAALALSAGLVAAPAAFAQQAAQPAASAAGSAAAPGGPSSGWVKLCGTDQQSKKEICFVQREIRTDTGQFMASAGIREVKGESRKILLVQVPTGMLIQPGMRVQADKNKQEAAKYTICFPNACFAELVVNDDFVAGLKRGNNLVLTTLNQQGKGVTFQISLSGFTAAYDGAPLDTAALQREQQRLQEELQRKAKEAQQKLIDAQKNAQEQAEQQ